MTISRSQPDSTAEPVAFVPCYAETGPDIAMARKKRHTIERYIKESRANAVVMPLYAAPPSRSDAVNARVRVAEYICHRFICANAECDGCQPSSVALEHADTILALSSAEGNTP